MAGTIQNDILKEFYGAQHHIYIRRSSWMRIIADIFIHVARICPSSTRFPYQGYHMQEVGCYVTLEACLYPSPTVSNISPRRYQRRHRHRRFRSQSVSFFWAIGMTTSVEVAPRCRAHTSSLGQIVKQFLEESKSLFAPHTHSQTSGWSLTRLKDPSTTSDRMYRSDGRCPRPHTVTSHQRSFDEAIALPTILRTYRT